MATTSSLDLSRTYSSFSGTDIRIVVRGEVVGQAQAVSYAIQREKAPIYVLGHKDPLSFSRGKRGIAGTLIALLLDQHLLFHKPFSDAEMKVILDKDEIYASPTDLNDASSTDNDLVFENVFTAGDLSANYSSQNARYMDELPPFDIQPVAVNEYGMAATMRIYGVELLNEGAGFSIDDMQLESQMTYVCRTILGWQKLGSWDRTTGVFTQSSPSSTSGSSGVVV